jgi:hypothetical protein
LEELGAKPNTVTPTSANIPDNGEYKPDSKDMLQTLEGAFLTPMLSLLKIYLKETNGTRKTMENCMLDFRKYHPNILKLFFVIDFCFRLIYMFVLLVVVVRGLGIGEYLVSLKG